VASKGFSVISDLELPRGLIIGWLSKPTAHPMSGFFLGYSAKTVPSEKELQIALERLNEIFDDPTELSAGMALNSGRK